MFIEASGGKKIIKRALRKQTPGRQISFDILYDCWKETMKSKWGVEAEPPEFPEGNEVLETIWRQNQERDARIPELLRKHIRSVIQKPEECHSPGL